MKLTKEKLRQKRQRKIRSTINGTSLRPRISVYRSLRSISAQLIDDSTGIVIVSSSSLKDKKGSTVEAAKKVGLDLAKKAKAKKVEQCVFDRSGYLYHGRIKALADGAREGGLKF